MRSLERRFKKLQDSNPALGDFVVLRHAVSGMGFSKKIIDQHFNNLVPTDDYAKQDKKALLENLYHATKPTEEGKK